MLNQLLLNFTDFSVENIKNSIFKLLRTGGNHSMIVNNKFEMYIQINNNDKSGFDTNMYPFNLKDLFNH